MPSFYWLYTGLFGKIILLAGSSNGRTAGFDPADLGSNPSPATMNHVGFMASHFRWRSHNPYMVHALNPTWFRANRNI